MEILDLNTICNLVQGDTFPGVSMALKEDNIPVDLTGASIKIGLVNQVGVAVGEWSTANGAISITNAIAGEFQINQIDRLTLPAGVLIKGDLQVTLANNDRFTYCQIHLTVQNDFTK